MDLSPTAPPPTARLNVYVSSTITDLADHRRAVFDAIAQVGGKSTGVEELIPSVVKSVAEVCREQVLASNVFILIVAHRYGAILPGQTKSLNEIEYGIARKQGVPVLAFIVRDDYPWPTHFMDHGDAKARLAAFKERLRQEVPSGYFTTPSDLAGRVLEPLLSLLRAHGVLKPEPPNSAAVAITSVEDSVVGRIENQLNSLDAAVSDIRARLDLFFQQGDKPREVMREPASFLGPAAGRAEEDVCFVAMPYSKSWSRSLEDTLLDICKNSGMRLTIAKNMDGRFVPHDIWRGITAAAVIVADITDGNPNVAYEVGLADVLGKEVILLCQGDKVPFDFLGQRLICYEDSIKGGIMLREELGARLRRVRERFSGTEDG